MRERWDAKLRVVFRDKPPDNLPRAPFHVGGFTVYCDRKLVLKRELSLLDSEAEGEHVPDKALAVLVYLARRQGEICTRRELLDSIWGPSRHVYERVLDTAVRDVRRAFGDSAKDPHYVRTFPKRGYSLVAPVDFGASAREEPVAVTVGAPHGAQGETEDAVEVDAELDDGEIRFGRHLRRYRQLLVLMVAVLALGAVAASLSRPTFVLAINRIIVDGLEVSGIEAELARLLHQADGCSGSKLYRYSRLSFLTRNRIGGSLRAYGDQLFLDMHITKLRSGDVFLPQIKGPWSEGHGRLLEQVALQIRHRVDQEICSFDQGLPAVGDRACHCEQAAERFRVGRQMQNAKRYFQHVLAEDPARLSSVDGLANVHQTLGEDEQALDLLEKVKAFSDAPLGSREALELDRRLAQVREDFQQEGTLLYQLLSLEDERVEDSLAWAWFQQTHRADCEASLSIFRDVQSKEPDRPVVWAYIAEAELECGDPREALRASETYTETEPFEPDAWDSLALVLRGLGYRDRAGEALRQALHLDGTYPPSLLQRIAWFRDFGYFDQARMELNRYERYVEGPRAQTEVAMHGAHLALLEGGFEQAERYIDEAVEIDEKRVEALWLAGRIALAQGDLAEVRMRAVAIRRLREERGTWWQMEMYHHLNAELALAENRLDDGIDELQKALDLSPPNAGFYRTALARAYMQAGDWDAAESELDRVLSVGGEFPRALCLQAELAVWRGDRERALWSYERMDELWLKNTPDMDAQACRQAMTSFMAPRPAAR